MAVSQVQFSVLAARGAVGYLPGSIADVDTGSRRRQQAAQGPHSRWVGQPRLVDLGILEIAPSPRLRCTDTSSFQGLGTT